MGMSMHIKGFVSEDNLEYQKHKNILLFCRESNVSLPVETQRYFNSDQYPSLNLLSEKLEFELIKGEHYIKYSVDMEDGFEIDLAKIPEDIKKIRVYNLF